MGNLRENNDFYRHDIKAARIAAEQGDAEALLQVEFARAHSNWGVASRSESGCELDEGSLSDDALVAQCTWLAGVELHCSEALLHVCDLAVKHRKPEAKEFVYRNAVPGAPTVLRTFVHLLVSADEHLLRWLQDDSVEILLDFFEQRELVCPEELLRELVIDACDAYTRSLRMDTQHGGDLILEDALYRIVETVEMQVEDEFVDGHAAVVDPEELVQFAVDNSEAGRRTRFAVRRIMTPQLQLGVKQRVELYSGWSKYEDVLDDAIPYGLDSDNEQSS